MPNSEQSFRVLQNRVRAGRALMTFRRRAYGAASRKLGLISEGGERLRETVHFRPQ
jgi:hypothetical protein